MTDNQLDRLLRLNQIIGDSEHLPFIPISKSSWWAGIKNGKYPAGFKLIARTTVWRASEVYALLSNVAASDTKQPH